MQLSNYTVLVLLEIFLVLIATGTLLAIYAYNQRKLIRRQQERLKLLISELKRLKLPTVEITGNTYKTHVSSQIVATRNRYIGLFPDGDINLEQPTENAPTNQALALRHQFLLIEEIAINKGDGPLRINWQAFEDSLDRLLGKIPNNDALAELAINKKEIANLEKFRQLFFEMEEHWQEAQQEAQSYYLQLQALAKDANDSDQFSQVLERYNNVYRGIDNDFNTGRTTFANQAHHIGEQKIIEVTKIDLRSAEEIIKLRNVAADQHRIINQLQKRLAQAITAEEKEAVIGELEQQLQRQVRFVQESETCIKLLEDELSTATEKTNKQQLRLNLLADTEQENQRIKETLQNFVLESKALMSDLLSAENENKKLQEELKQLQSQLESNPTDKQGNDLKDAHLDLLALKNQYADLEAKYLKIKLKN